MNTTMTMLKTLATILIFGLGISGCYTTGTDTMMDDSMTAPMETMNKGNMDETMSPSMNDMKEDKTMDKTMSVPMNTMEKTDMGSGMSDTMK